MTICFLLAAGLFFHIFNVNVCVRHQILTFKLLCIDIHIHEWSVLMPIILCICQTVVFWSFISLVNNITKKQINKVINGLTDWFFWAILYTVFISSFPNYILKSCSILWRVGEKVRDTNRVRQRLCMMSPPCRVVKHIKGWLGCTGQLPWRKDVPPCQTHRCRIMSHCVLEFCQKIVSLFLLYSFLPPFLSLTFSFSLCFPFPFPLYFI